MDGKEQLLRYFVYLYYGKGRKKLHSIIDELESEEQLENMLLVMEPEASYQTRSWLDDLDDEQLSRLNKSLEQADKGEFISHESVKAKYAAWLK